MRNPKLNLLPDQDSNLDKRYQKPSYYLYTIGQSPQVCNHSKKERKYRTIFGLSKGILKIERL